MRNKSLIFLALIVLGVVGCNKETTVAKETEGTKDVVAAVVEQQDKDGSVVAPATTGVADTNATTEPVVSK